MGGKSLGVRDMLAVDGGKNVLKVAKSKSRGDKSSFSAMNAVSFFFFFISFCC